MLPRSKSQVESSRTIVECIGVGSKFEVQRPCCVARSAAKRMEIYFAARSAAANFFKCAPLDCKIKPFFNGV